MGQSIPDATLLPNFYPVDLQHSGLNLSLDLQCFRKRINLGSAGQLEPRHAISNNVVCATSKASDPLIRAFASHLNIFYEC